MQYSVIVPVYRQWEMVPDLLAALVAQDFPAASFETILVDNGTPDFAPPRELPTNARILRCAAPGAYAARNEGAREAKGDWLLFTDADCRPEPGWLAGFARAGGARLLAGPVDIVMSEKPSLWEIHDCVRSIPQERYVRRGYGATANLAVERGLFLDLGGFDAARYSGGDAEFCRRAARAGARIAFAPDARVLHLARQSWPEARAKARRVLAGQVRHGPALGRLVRVLRAALPPIIDWGRYAMDRRHQPRHRLVAILVEARLWGTRIAELVRLAAGGAPERR